MVAPEETWARIRPELHRFGITRVADITGLDRIGIPVAIAVRPLSRSIVVSAGKGETLIAAKVSAAMEAIECAHAERIDRPLKFASRREIAATSEVPPFARLPLLASRSLTEDTPLLWIEGLSLDDGAPVMVPYDLVHAHYCPFGLPAAGAFQATTNGLSSGNCFSEAVAHGLFEVIERDALSLWNRMAPEKRRPRLNNSSLGKSALVGATVRKLEVAGFQVAIWDITSDVAVPAFHCIVVDAADPAGHPGTGTGCHPDKNVAVFRALTEAAQVRGIYISGGRDDLLRSEYETAHMQSFRDLLDAHPVGKEAAFEALPSLVTEMIEDDIAWASERLAGVGCGPVIAVDLSRPGTGISVVRVIVPGLEGPHAEDARPGERMRRIAG